MKESIIRKKAIDKLKGEGWTTWWPAKVKFHESDVFGCYDILACKGNKVRWIQITSLSNIRARERKIVGFLRASGARLPSEVWGLRKDKTFKIIKI